jgi:hypothetical protein
VKFGDVWYCMIILKNIQVNRDRQSPMTSGNVLVMFENVPVKF